MTRTGMRVAATVAAGAVAIAGGVALGRAAATSAPQPRVGLPSTAAPTPAPSGSIPPYSRAAFGPTWPTDGGCDARNRVLAHDLTDVTVTGGCTVLSGTLHDPYTGRTIAFRRGVGTSTAVQIDHVVALADAWYSGASGWTGAQRQAYANDPAVLLAVDGPTNESKGERGPGEWVPPDPAERCDYARRYVSVKARYGLTTTERDWAGIGRDLASCFPLS